jgi:hypothetical protein
MTGNFSTNVLLGDGSTTIVSGHGVDAYTFLDGSDNNVLIQGFSAALDYIALAGFPSGEANAALSGATTVMSGGSASEQLKLSDGTQITFQGFTGLTSGNFLG